MVMKTLAAAIMLLCGTALKPLYATNLMPIDENSSEPVKISHTLTNTSALASNTFLAGEQIKLSFSLTVAEQDVGQMANLVLVAVYNNKLYELTANQGWQAWDGQLSTLTSFKSKTLEKQEQIQVLNNQTLPASEYLLYAGYTLQGNGDKPLFYNSTPAAFVVFDANSAKLRRINHKPVLTALFERGSQTHKNGGITAFQPFSPVSASIPTASPTTDSSSSSSTTSQTNLQEVGVDESDRIKVEGDRLYIVESCAQEASKQCLAAYRMQENPAGTTALGSLLLGNASYQGALYNIKASVVDTQKHLVYINSSMQYPIFDVWFSPYYWGNNTTELKFIDVTQPDNMQVKSTITLNTSLLSSRVVGNVLYIVTRKNPYFDYGTDPNKPIALGAPASTLTPSDLEDSVQVLPTPPPTQPKEIDELLPTIAFNGAKATPLVNANDCYIPAQSSDKPVDNTLVAITAIPLTNPNNYYSVCIAGSVDTFYMSTQALYLATTRYPYQLSGNTLTFDHKRAEVTTELHKFKLAKDALVYAGSGSVPGHLGWEADKQPFRMGEYNHTLKVATSLGDTWNDTSTTRVSVLQEDAASQTLKEIGVLNNLGKKGERLYAARFLQDRGYLVTYKTTDPLYVLDFSKPAQPEIVGELQINGYSDYLHPLGNNYLLGIGKDAIPDNTPTASIFGGDSRGAWYQGVKLSLFDVSSKDKLREVESVVIGKRGTDSGALHDHHALAWLPAADNSAKGTLSIPIQLHNNLLPSSQLQYYAKDYYSTPSAYYDWTHTGLYTFSIDTAATPAIKLHRRLITDVNNPDTYNENWSNRSTYQDRAVIQGNTVHYVHNNRIVSADISKR